MNHASAPMTVITPTRGLLLPNARDLWAFRELLFFLARRDITIRYKQTYLGFAWVVLQPVAMTAVLVACLNRIAGTSNTEIPYPLFVLAGLAPWNLFASTFACTSGSVVGSERLVGKVYFPRLIIPLAAAGTPLVDLAVALGFLTLLVLGYALSGAAVGFAPTAILAPLFLIPVQLAAAGIGSLMAALMVLYRDFRVLVAFIIQFGLLATPAVFLDTSAGGWLVWLNPLNPLVAGFRAALLGGSIPWAGALTAALLAVGMFGVGCVGFRNLEPRFADEL